MKNNAEILDALAIAEPSEWYALLDILRDYYALDSTLAPAQKALRDSMCFLVIMSNGFDGMLGCLGDGFQWLYRGEQAMKKIGAEEMWQVVKQAIAIVERLTGASKPDPFPDDPFENCEIEEYGKVDWDELQAALREPDHQFYLLTCKPIEVSVYRRIREFVLANRNDFD